MSSIPTESRIFADRYSREARRLEQLHASRLAPGATTWEQAVEALFQQIVKVGPVKGAKLVQKAIDYLNGVVSDERSYLMIVGHCTSRTAFLAFATFLVGPHPDQRVKEEGVTIALHILHCSRSRPARVSGIPVAHFSKHAIARLHQRGQDITENTHAATAFSFAGVLGYLTHRSPKHADGGLCLLFADTLLVGSLHRFASTDARGHPIDEVFFDIRTALAVDEIGDRMVNAGARLCRSRGGGRVAK
jgi:hypothetical protein